MLHENERWGVANMMNNLYYEDKMEGLDGGCSMNTSIWRLFQE